MKKTSKAQQLRLVRNVVRQLTAQELAPVVGGAGGRQSCATCTDSCHGNSMDCNATL